MAEDIYFKGIQLDNFLNICSNKHMHLTWDNTAKYSNIEYLIRLYTEYYHLGSSVVIHNSFVEGCRSQVGTQLNFLTYCCIESPQRVVMLYDAIQTFIKDLLEVLPDIINQGKVNYPAYFGNILIILRHWSHNLWDRSFNTASGY